jgi:hypothetical protein
MVGVSGSHKSPALDQATSHLRRKQDEAVAEYDEAMARYEQELAVYERSRAQWKQSKTGDPLPWEPERPVYAYPERPVCRRSIVGDITIEALADLLSNQEDGVLAIRDELAGWLDGMAQYKGGKGSDTGHWLAMWSAASLTMDRKTGDKRMIHVPRAAVSLIGGVQPDILRRAIGHEHMQDGLCARLLVVMPPLRPVRWSDATVDPTIEAKVSEVYDKLLGLDGAADANGRPAPYPISLAPDAKKVWVKYYNRHREEQADLDTDLAAAWSKLEAYTARFALIIQMVRAVTGDSDESAVDSQSMRAAIELSDWFGGETRRVYRVLAESGEDRDRRRLAEWIERRGGSMTIREVQQGHRQYRTSSDAEAALDELVKAGYGTWEPTPSGKRGRPTRRFVLPTASTVYGNALNLGEDNNTVDVDGVDALETHPADEEWGEL